MGEWVGGWVGPERFVVCVGAACLMPGVFSCVYVPRLGQLFLSYIYLTVTRVAREVVFEYFCCVLNDY